MSGEHTDGYWSGLIEFHQQQAEAARDEVLKLKEKLARSKRWRIKNDATLVAENLRLRAVIAEAVQNCEKGIRASMGTSGAEHYATGMNLQARDTLRILAKATQTDKETTK